MPLPNREKELAFNEVGETTGERYTGTFRIKRILTQREEFLADLRRRSILGPNPENAIVAIVNNAFTLGQLSVRIIEGPSWWNPNEDDVGGLDMLDMNILASLFEECMRADAEWRAEDLRANFAGGVDFLATHDGELLGLTRLRQPGAHNASNAMAALVVTGCGFRSGVAVGTTMRLANCRNWPPSQHPPARFRPSPRSLRLPQGQRDQLPVLASVVHYQDSTTKANRTGTRASRARIHRGGNL